MAIKQTRSELMKMVEYTKTRINAGETMSQIARDMGIKRDMLEYRLMIAGYRIGRAVLPIHPIDDPSHTTEAAQ